MSLARVRAQGRRRFRTRKDGVVFRQAREPEPQAGDNQGRRRRAAGGSKKSEPTRRGADEREVERPVGHHPAPGRSEKERREVERDERDQAGARAEQAARSANGSQPVAANRTTNGRRVAALSPNTKAAKCAFHRCSGG